MGFNPAFKGLNLLMNLMVTQFQLKRAAQLDTYEPFFNKHNCIEIQSIEELLE